MDLRPRRAGLEYLTAGATAPQGMAPSPPTTARGGADAVAGSISGGARALAAGTAGARPIRSIFLPAFSCCCSLRFCLSTWSWVRSATGPSWWCCSPKIFFRWRARDRACRSWRLLAGVVCPASRRFLSRFQALFNVSYDTPNKFASADVDQPSSSTNNISDSRIAASAGPGILKARQPAE